MSYIHQSDVAYVSADGSYSQSEEVITFPTEDLNEEQWDILSTLPDSEKIIFALACLNGEDITEYTDEYL